MTLLLYLLKASGALLLLLGLYCVLLRRLTFYRLNRFYLLFAIGFAAVCPWLGLGHWNEVPLADPVSALVISGSTAGAPVVGAAISTANLVYPGLLGLYSIGVLVLGGQLVWRLVAMLRLRRTSIPSRAHGVAFRQLALPVSPFTFGPDIYIGAGVHSETELQAVLLHEQVHARQAHTFDVLLAHVVKMLNWFNPAAWLLPGLVQENLEFLTDAAVLQAGYLPTKDYQFSLLRISSREPSPQLTSSFSLLSLRKRIAKMNQPESGRAQVLRYALVLPIAAGLLLTLPAAMPVARPRSYSPLPASALYYIDGEPVDQATVEALDSKAIKKVTVLQGAEVGYVFSEATQDTAIIVVTSENESSAAAAALDARLPQARPITGNDLPNAAQAYIEQNHPGGLLTSVWEITALGQPVRYRAEISNGVQPALVLFDQQGRPLK